MADEQSSVLVIDAEMWGALGLHVLTEWLEAQPDRRQVVFRYDCVSRSTMQVECPEHLEYAICLSSRAHEPLGLYLSEWGSNWPTTPAWRIERLLKRVLARSDLDTIATLVFMCERVVSEREAASALGLSASGFRERLSRLRILFPSLPTFPKLVATLVTLHSLWEMEWTDWSDERIAQHAGYGDPRVFATYVWRGLGRTPGGLLKRGGYTLVENRFLSWF
jgi:hypothetical protein